MTSSLTTHQRAVIAAARAFLDGHGTREAFLALLERTDYDDAQLAEVIVRVRRLPSASNVFGVGQKEHAREVAETKRLIEAVEAGVR